MATKNENKKSRAWLTIVYPESAPEGWRDKLSECGMQCLISPLHDKDVKADTGEIKKAHWHVVLIWDGPTTYGNAHGYVEQIGGVGCIACASLRGAARYLTHEDDPDKYHYNKADVQTLGGVDYEGIISTPDDEMSDLIKIFDYIEHNEIISFRVLLRRLLVEQPRLAKLVLSTQRENVWRYLRSYEYDRSFEYNKGGKDDEEDRDN